MEKLNHLPKFTGQKQASLTLEPMVLIAELLTLPTPGCVPSVVQGSPRYSVLFGRGTGIFFVSIA